MSGSASVQQRRRTDSPVRAFRTPLPALIPRLFAFFRHTITSVRLAVVRTFLVFLRLPTLAPSWVDATFCRLLFQNLLLEERAEIREATFSAWTACLARLGPSVPALVTAQINNWFALLNTQIGTAIDRRLLSFGASGDSTSKGRVYSVDKPMLNQDLALVTPESILRCRVAAATAIGALMSAWPGVLPNDFKQQIESGLQSASALQRTLAAIVIEEWASRTVDKTALAAAPLTATLVPLLHNLLAADPPEAYQETTPILQRVRSDCTAFYACFTSQGKVPADRLPSIPEPFGRNQADLVTRSYEALMAIVPAKAKKVALPQLEERHKQLLASVAYHDSAKSRYDRQVFAAIGSAVIALKSIPAKITPLIRSVTNSIKVRLRKCNSGCRNRSLIGGCSNRWRTIPTCKLAQLRPSQCSSTSARLRIPRCALTRRRSSSATCAPSCAKTSRSHRFSHRPSRPRPES